MTPDETAFWEAQRLAPNDTLLMLVFADWLADQGRELEGECMRLLGETGKVGATTGYYPLPMPHGYEALLPYRLIVLTSDMCKKKTGRLHVWNVIRERQFILEIWANATPGQHAGWEAEIRAGHAERLKQMEVMK